MLLRHMHEMFSIMDKRENDGVCIGQQLEELEGRKAEEDAVQEWNEAVKRERSLRNKLQAVEAVRMWCCLDMLLTCLANHLHSKPFLAADDTFQSPLLRAVVNRIVTLTLPELTCVVLRNCRLSPKISTAGSSLLTSTQLLLFSTLLIQKRC